MTAISDRDRILSFHPRKQHNFEQAACLSELYPARFAHVTSIYFGPSLVKLVGKISPYYAGKIGKRSYFKLLKKYVYTLPYTEIKRWLLERKHGPAHLPDYMDLNEYWQKSVLSRFEPPKVCISYDGISHHLFREWKNKSILVLDLAIGLPQYRIKIQHGDQFHNGMLDEVDKIQKKLFAWYKEEVELADIILCGSQFVKKTVVYFFPEFENKCKLLPYGTDLKEFSYPEREFEQKKDVKFAFVGRLSWRKGADLMLDAWRDFVVDHPLAELHFFGTPDSEITLGQLPENVFIHGWIKKADLIASLKTMDVFVFPTTFEGSSIAVFQAMAMKLPVITTLNSGTVLKHGESCEIVEAGDRAGLVNAMDKLLHNPEYRQKLAENGYALSKNYSWDDYKQRLGKILDEINI
ncbi:MAG TPA: glycosyltransferase family 4 protein [Puia sp.]|jgi:glycosyltransferase involved in cell wall biosynthesis|nr:glycosyltransferase family 4 protein [Puia sp.]